MPNQYAPSRHGDALRDNSVKRIQLRKGILEVDDCSSAMSSVVANRKMRENFHVPSGMSIEADVCSEDTTKSASCPKSQRQQFREGLKKFNQSSGFLETDER